MKISIFLVFLLAGCSITKLKFDEKTASTLIDYGVSSNTAIFASARIKSIGIGNKSTYIIEDKNFKICVSGGSRILDSINASAINVK